MFIHFFQLGRKQSEKTQKQKKQKLNKMKILLEGGPQTGKGGWAGYEKQAASRKLIGSDIELEAESEDRSVTTGELG
jgi:hypothetical protein